MGFRFRKSVSLLPGVRINFSLSGVSATIGPRGASMTVGPRGTHVNLGLPGTGLSYRTRLSPSKRPQASAVPSVPAPPDPDPPPRVGLDGMPPADPHLYGRVEYRSRAAKELSSPELLPLADLVAELVDRQNQLATVDAKLQSALHVAERRMRRASGPFLAWITAKRRPFLAHTIDELKSLKATIAAQTDECAISAEFDVGDDALSCLREMAAAFDVLRASAAIWDISDSAFIDRKATRSAASQSITRQPVRFDASTIPMIKCATHALHLRNANGGDLFVYPSFVAIRRSDGRHSFIRLRDIRLESNSTRFIEEEGIPTDAERVGEAWAKANKDGSPDRRFADNYRIPILRYGQLYITSDTGLNEAYMFSDWRACEAFHEAFTRYQRAVASREGAAEPTDADSADEATGLAPLDIPVVPEVPSLLDARGWAAAGIGAGATAALALALAQTGSIGPSPNSPDAMPSTAANPSKSGDNSGANAASARRPTTTAAIPSTPLPPPLPPPPGARPPTTEKLTRDEIMVIQRRLRELGFEPGPADGVAGARTLAAIAAYERSKGRPASALLSTRLLNEMRMPP